LLALTVALALSVAAGCGDDGTGTGRVPGNVPMGDQAFVGCGFPSINVTLPCTIRQAGADGQCTFVLTTSNSGVAALAQSVFVVPANATRTFLVTLSATRSGSTVIRVLDELGFNELVGTVNVSGC